MKKIISLLLIISHSCFAEDNTPEISYELNPGECIYSIETTQLSQCEFQFKTQIQVTKVGQCSLGFQALHEGQQFIEDRLINIKVEQTKSALGSFINGASFTILSRLSSSDEDSKLEQVLIQELEQQRRNLQEYECE